LLISTYHQRKDLKWPLPANKNPCSLAIGITAGNAIISYKGGGLGFQETAAKMKNLNLEIEIM